MSVNPLGSSSSCYYKDPEPLSRKRKSASELPRGSESTSSKRTRDAEAHSKTLSLRNREVHIVEPKVSAVEELDQSPDSPTLLEPTKDLEGQSLDLTDYQPSERELSEIVQKYRFVKDLKLQDIKEGDVIKLLSELKHLDSIELCNIELTPKIARCLSNMKGSLTALVIKKTLPRDICTYGYHATESNNIEISEKIFNQLSEICNLQRLQLECVALKKVSFEKFHNWICQVEDLSLKFCIFPEEWSSIRKNDLKKIVTTPSISVEHLTYFSNARNRKDNASIASYLFHFNKLVSTDLLSICSEGNIGEAFAEILTANKNLKKVRLTGYSPDWYGIKSSCFTLENLESLTLCHTKTSVNCGYAGEAESDVSNFFNFFGSLVVPPSLRELKLVNGMNMERETDTIEALIFGAIVKNITKQQSSRADIPVAHFPALEITSEWVDGEQPIDFLTSDAFICDSPKLHSIIKG